MRNYGLKIPEDLSIIGYDNIFISEITDPPLTTVERRPQNWTRLLPFCSMLSKGKLPKKYHTVSYTESPRQYCQTGSLTACKKRAAAERIFKDTFCRGSFLLFL